MSSFMLLFTDNLRAWLRPKGLALVLVACLVPPGLTAAWVFTHQADVSVASVTHDADVPRLGGLLNVTAVFRNELDDSVGPFNATIQVGYFENRTGALSFRAVKEEGFNVTGLGPGASAAFRMNWTAEPGTYIFRAQADVGDALAELEELNNERYVQVYVPFPQVTADFDSPAPPRPASATGESDLAVSKIEWGPKALFAGQATKFQVQVLNKGPDEATNATLRLRVHQATLFGYSPTPARTLNQAFTLASGNTTTVALEWTPSQVGQYAFVANVIPNARQWDGNTSNDVAIQEAFIDREFLYQEPPPKATAKSFYRDTLATLQLKILIPLVALFYAAGVVEDDKNRGSLQYLLTRPVPRWQLPVARFAAFGTIGSIAILLGMLATYVLLLGLPQGASGFLMWPLLFGVAALAAYGALFTLMGVALRRPYLAGLAYLLGVEAALYVGQTVKINGQPLVEEWVGNLSLTNWMLKAFAAWNPDGTGQWGAFGPEALQGFGVMAIVAIVGLFLAAWLVRRREVGA